MGLLIGAFAIALGGTLHARASAPLLTLRVPGDLHAGEHATATLDVVLPADAAAPLLVTPFREGEAIEVVRGRLLRADGRVQADGTLRFELPLLMHSAGSAVLGVRLLGYLCNPRCSALELEARSNVLVLPARAR